MKRLFFGLLVIATAIGTSAYTSQQQGKLRFATIYYQTSEGVYTPTFTGACNKSSQNLCTVVFDNDIDTSELPSFNIADLAAVEAEFGNATPTGNQNRY